MKIIGLSGKARSGKDTVAGMIQEFIPSSFIYALADPIKKAGSEMFGIPLDHFYAADVKEEPDDFWGISPREIAQKLGTEVGRDMFFTDMWIRRCEREIANRQEYEMMICGDIRFTNEADWVREQGGEIWHIVRPSIGTGVVREHVSETGIETVDGDSTIINDGNMLDLERKVNQILLSLD